MNASSPEAALSEDAVGVRDTAVHREVWFGPRERPLHGWLSMPAGATARGAVVLCPPMGEEGRSTHRTFRRLAEALAAEGLVALRFDYDGTGDSAGSQADPDRVAAWLGSITAARALLASLGAPTTAAVGMRLGATLAAQQACDEDDPWSHLVLWDPCRSGRTFLREGEALLMLSRERQDDVGLEVDAREAAHDGLHHTPGFQYDEETARALAAVDLASLPQTPLAGATLLLGRADRPVPGRVLRRLELEEGLERGEAHGQDELVDRPPIDSVVPRTTLSDVVDWLCLRTAGQEAFALGEPPAHTSVVVPSAGPGSTPVRERSAWLGEAGLFSIVTEPVDGARPIDSRGTLPTLVLVNVATEHHIGPGRLWVELGRRWAGEGWRVVRLDLTGVGDSPTAPGEPDDVIFSPHWVEDLPDLVRDLSPDGRGIVLAGLCSGAYSALETALRMQVEAVLAVNPRLTLWPAMRGTPGYRRDRRAASTPWSWMRRTAERWPQTTGGLWRIWQELAVWHAPMRVLWRVVRRRTRLVVLACPDDALRFREVVAWLPALWWLSWRGRRDRRFTFVRDERLDHALLTRTAQVTVARAMTEALEEIEVGWR